MARFDGLDSTITTTTTGVRATASFDSLRVLRLGEDYALSDLWLGADAPAINALSVRLSQGHEASWARTTNGDARDVTAAGRADRLHQGQLRSQPDADPVLAVGRLPAWR